MDASTRISGFCEENELDPQRSMLISLSLEEMLISIKNHVFPQDDTQSISIRILIIPDPDPEKTDSIILRIRCSGTPFNPIAYYEQQKSQAVPDPMLMPEDDGLDLDSLDDLLSGLDDSLGIAMIVQAAPAVDYKTTFGVNNLTIIL